MKYLNCSATFCVHNDNFACKRDLIDVYKVNDKALCRDYKPVGSTSYSYETAMERCDGVTSKCHTDIACSVKECKYQHNSHCYADNVDISQDEIHEYGKVKCQTFRRE